VRTKNKNAIAGILEQSGNGSDEARNAVEGILLVFVFEPRENAFKFHSSINVSKIRVRIAIE
jgi:hypothetical protein